MDNVLTDNLLMKNLPKALDAENSVLGAMIISKEAIKTAERMLVPTDFYRTANQIIFSTISKMNHDGINVDLVTLNDELQKEPNFLNSIGGMSYIANFLNVAGVISNLGCHAQIIKKRAIQRRLIETGIKIVNLGYQEEDIDSVLRILERLLDEVITKINMPIEKRSIDLKDVISSPLIETPFKKLNKLILGFQGGELIVIGGRMAEAKIVFILELLKFIAIEKKMRVAYFTWTKIETIYLRILSSICKIDYKHLIKGNLSMEQKEVLSETMKTINDTIYICNDASISSVGLDPSFIVSQTEALKNGKEGLGLIIIENLQWIQWSEKTQNKKEELDNVLYALKKMGLSLNVPIILFSQVNRRVEERPDKRPMLCDLTGSGSIEEIPDKVLFICQKEDQEKEEEFKAEIIIAKGGMGITGSTKILFCIRNYSCREE